MATTCCCYKMKKARANTFDNITSCYNGETTYYTCYFLGECKQKLIGK